MIRDAYSVEAEWAFVWSKCKVVILSRQNARLYQNCFFCRDREWVFGGATGNRSWSSKCKAVTLSRPFMISCDQKCVFCRDRMGVQGSLSGVKEERCMLRGVEMGEEGGGAFVPNSRSAASTTCVQHVAHISLEMRKMEHT